MKPYQERVVEEKKDLDVKIVALNAFVKTAVFCDLDLNEQGRLLAQKSAMSSYSDVLGERIKAFNEEVAA